MIRGVRVMLSDQPRYDAYHQAHDAQYQAYVVGDAKSEELRPDMEVAEGMTTAIGPAGLLEAMGLEREAVAGGDHRPGGGSASGDRGAARGAAAGRRPGRLQRPDLQRPEERQRGVRRHRGGRRHVAGGAAGRGRRGLGVGRLGDLLPAAARWCGAGIHSSVPMHAQLAALTNVHCAEQPINGADRPASRTYTSTPGS